MLRVIRERGRTGIKVVSIAQPSPSRASADRPSFLALSGFGWQAILLPIGLRHSLGMNLLEKDIPKEMVQKIYGHSRADMTDRYCEYQTKQMKVALESVVIHASWPAMSEPSAKRKGESNGEVVPFGKLERRDVTRI